MNNGFIKFARDSTEADFLQEYHPNAFLLLCLIARRARRFLGAPDGLKIAEAFIGDYRKAGIETEMKYRTAKKILVERGHIKIVETCRTRKKIKKTDQYPNLIENSTSEITTEITTGLTTTGTKVLLVKSDIWDINSEIDNDRKDDLRNDRITTEQRRIKKDKNERKEEEKNIQKEKSADADPLASSMLTEFFNSLLSFLPSFNSEKTKHRKTELAAMRRLLRMHGEEKVRIVFQFAHQSMFWRAHVHTAVYLEKKFETLLAQQSGGINGQNSQGPAFTGSTYRAVDRRTKNIDGTPVENSVKGLF